MLKHKIFNIYYWQSLFILVQASIFRQHKNSFLGSAWGLMQPFLHIVIMSYVFTFLLKQPTEVLVKNFVASLPLWNFITSSVNSSTKSLIDRSMILKKVFMPKTLLIISDVLVNCYTFAYSLLGMYVAYILIYPANFSFSILLSPFVLFPVIISVICVCMVLAYLTPYIMDIPQIVGVLLTAVYWALPIVYPYSLVPQNKQWLFEINPLFHLIRPLQILISENHFPPLIIMLKAILVMALIVTASILIVKKISRNVVYYL